jgi:hypothetical protein
MKNDFQPVVGHKFNFRAAPMRHRNGVTDCQVLVVEPYERLSYSWSASGEEAAGDRRPSSLGCSRRRRAAFSCAWNSRASGPKMKPTTGARVMAGSGISRAWSGWPPDWTDRTPARRPVRGDGRALRGWRFRSRRTGEVPLRRCGPQNGALIGLGVFSAQE